MQGILDETTALLVKERENVKKVTVEETPVIQEKEVIVEDAIKIDELTMEVERLKAHGLQLEAFSVAVKRLDFSLPKSRLQFVGSCRNKSDEERHQMLKNKAIELNVNEQVEFHKNVTYRSVTLHLH
ncbi:hypothetical protein HN51_069837 [Arachis hypogaea]